MCILYSFSITIIRDSPFSLSLSLSLFTVSMQVQELELTTSHEVNDPSSPEISPDSDDISNLNLLIAARKGIRICTQHLLYLLSHFVSHDRLSPSHRNFLTSLNTIVIPKTLSKTLNCKEWKQATRAKIEALEKNGIWDVVELPREKSPVGCKWVFTSKYNCTSSQDEYCESFTLFSCPI